MHNRIPVDYQFNHQEAIARMVPGMYGRLARDVAEAGMEFAGWPKSQQRYIRFPRPDEAAWPVKYDAELLGGVECTSEDADFLLIDVYGWAVPA